MLTGGKAVTPQAYTREGPSRITERSERQHFLYLSKASEGAQQSLSTSVRWGICGTVLTYR